MGLEDTVVKYVKKNVSKEDYDRILRDYGKYSFVPSILMSAIHHHWDIVDKFLSMSVMEYKHYLLNVKDTKPKKNTKRKASTISYTNNVKAKRKRVKTRETAVQDIGSVTQTSVRTVLPKPFYLVEAKPNTGNTFLKPRGSDALNFWQVKILRCYAKKYDTLLNSDVECIVEQLNGPKYRNKTNQESVEKFLAINKVTLDKYAHLDMSKLDLIETPRPNKIKIRFRSIYTNWQLNVLLKYHKKYRVPSLEMCHVIVKQLNSSKYENDMYIIEIKDIYKYFRSKTWVKRTITPRSTKKEGLINDWEKLTESNNSTGKQPSTFQREKYVAPKSESEISELNSSQDFSLKLCVVDYKKMPEEDTMSRLSYDIGAPLDKVRKWMQNHFSVTT